MRRQFKDYDDPLIRWLGSATTARAEANRHKRRVAELESRATRITSYLSNSRGGNNADLQELWSILADARNKELYALKAEMKLYEEVETFIDRLPVPVMRTVMKLRYLEDLPWAKVVRQMQKDHMYYVERSAHRTHKIALELAREMWNAEHPDNPSVPATHGVSEVGDEVHT